MRRDAYLDANNAVVPLNKVRLYVTNAKRRLRGVRPTKLENLPDLAGIYEKGSDVWYDCISLNLLRCIVTECNGQTVEEAKQRYANIASAHAICVALYELGVRRLPYRE